MGQVGEEAIANVTDEVFSGLDSNHVLRICDQLG